MINYHNNSWRESLGNFTSNWHRKSPDYEKFGWYMCTYGWRCESETRVPSSRGLVKQYNQELCISSNSRCFTKRLQSRPLNWKISTYLFTNLYAKSFLTNLKGSSFRTFHNLCRVFLRTPYYFQNNQNKSQNSSSHYLSAEQNADNSRGSKLRTV